MSDWLEANATHQPQWPCCIGKVYTIVTFLSYIRDNRLLTSSDFRLNGSAQSRKTHHQKKEKH
jgi:hypothetical protein